MGEWFSYGSRADQKRAPMAVGAVSLVSPLGGRLVASMTTEEVHVKIGPSVCQSGMKVIYPYEGWRQ
jgi:hypothetical protein